MTGYRHVRAVMEAAGIEGQQASPKGLRHGFAVAALEAGVPINLVQRWLGHAHWSTTAIYADVIGPEERGFAERLWLATDASPSAASQPRREKGQKEAGRRSTSVGRAGAGSPEPTFHVGAANGFNRRKKSEALSA